MSQELSDSRIRLVAWISKLHPDTLIGPREIAAMSGTTVGSIHQLRAKHPERLPPTAGVGGWQLRWHLGTARKWLHDRATAATAASTTAVKRTGRPRNV